MVEIVIGSYLFSRIEMGNHRTIHYHEWLVFLCRYKEYTNSKSGKANVLSITPYLLGSSRMLPGSTQSQATTNSILMDLIVQEGMPLRIVDSIGFNLFLGTINSRYRSPCRKTFVGLLNCQKTESNQGDTIKRKTGTMWNGKQYCGHMVW